MQQPLHHLKGGNVVIKKAVVGHWATEAAGWVHAAGLIAKIINFQVFAVALVKEAAHMHVRVPPDLFGSISREPKDDHTLG